MGICQKKIGKNPLFLLHCLWIPMKIFIFGRGWVEVVLKLFSSFVLFTFPGGVLFPSRSTIQILADPGVCTEPVVILMACSQDAGRLLRKLFTAIAWWQYSYSWSLGTFSTQLVTGNSWIQILVKPRRLHRTCCGFNGLQPRRASQAGFYVLKLRNLFFFICFVHLSFWSFVSK